MNKNLQYIKKIAPMVITLVFIAGVVSAYNYNAPPADKSVNTDTLVNVGSSPNTKPGDISVDAFTAAQDANFDSSVTFFGALHGVPNGTGTKLRFGGYDELRQKTRTVNVLATGNIQASAGLFSQKTTTTTGTTPLCATSSGEVVLCDTSAPAVAPICGNGVLQSGEQCDDGNTVSGDGCSNTCTVEPPPVITDLCPDATNPNPAFVGIQNPLPAWAEIRNGLCKIKISADVTYKCVGSSPQGNVKYTFAFDRPVPDDMMIYVASVMKGPFGNPPSDHLAFTTPYYNFQFEPVTTEQASGYYINLKKGMASYTTPFPKLSTGPQEDPYQSSTNEQQCLDPGSLSYAKTWAVYFKVGVNSPDYVTDFRLKDYTGPVSGFHYMNQ